MTMNLQSPVDVVYLWVDGNDPAWRQKRRLAQVRLGAGQHHTMAVFGNVEGRFRDNDELRYSLRALDQFFPATARFTWSPMPKPRPGYKRMPASRWWTIAP